jgi:hypothetical protein
MTADGCGDGNFDASLAQLRTATLRGLIVYPPGFPSAAYSSFLILNSYFCVRPSASRYHLRAHRAALPAREPSPVRSDVRLRSAGRTGRDRKPGASLRFPVRRSSAPNTPVTSRLLRPRFSPFPFVCHIKFLSSDFPVASLRRSHLEDFHFSTRAESRLLNSTLGVGRFLPPFSRIACWHRAIL